LKFADKNKPPKEGSDLSPYTIISLGQGQKEFAIDAIQKGIQHGTWVLL